MRSAFAALAVLMACSQTPADSQTGSKPATPGAIQTQPGTEKARQQTPDAKPQTAAQPTAPAQQQSPQPPAAKSSDAQSQPPTQTQPEKPNREKRVYLYQHAQYGWIYHYPSNPNNHFYDPNAAKTLTTTYYQPTYSQPTYNPPVYNSPAYYQPAPFASPSFGGFGGFGGRGNYCPT
jgi:hypothetical protein